MSLPTICTIGYERATPDGLLAALRQHRVACLVDVRAIPNARGKPIFSKTKLAAWLEENGIAYRHIRALGTPAEGRAAAREGDHATLRRIYSRHLQGAEAQAAFADLVGMATEQRVCLLCLEREPKACHRSLLTDILEAEHGFRVEHAFADGQP
ncbi:DUF488 domain-containing protein [Marinivivus vitaminiproducens]|uniref:DUF488 domain-containing protein n=1 Tax=Marinivivus vitaminiproducens TaxID=3035935 RepID=UPI0027A1AE6C|nr:DUF488 domain-containing protein [Geminicoccaceae bacterium SCSIO 64248]